MSVQEYVETADYLETVSYGLGLFFEIITVLLLIIAVLITIGVVVTLVLHSVLGVALYRIAKNQGFKRPWFSWIPLFNLFLLAFLIEEVMSVCVFGRAMRFTHLFGVVLLLSVALVFATHMVAFLVTPFILLMYGFYALSTHYSTEPNTHIGLAITSLGLTVPFQLLRFSKRKRIEPARIADSLLT